jgi:transposase
LVFELGCICKADLRQREIAVSQLGRIGETKQKPQSVQQVRIVPKADHYVVEVVYQTEEKSAEGLDLDLFAALDPGVNILAALTSNKSGFIPRLVSGGPVKAVNQLYNKQREHEQKQLAKGKEPRFTSHRLDRITTKRNRRVMHYLHTASRRIIERLVAEGIGTLVLGKNPFWKTCVELGKKNNQEFVHIPHAKFLELLTRHRQRRLASVWSSPKRATPARPAFSTSMCCPPMIQPREPSRRRNRVSLVLEMAVGIASKDVLPFIPM